jgi:hypothetical protein
MLGEKKMRQYSDKALEMKLSLEAGLIDVKDVIAWADTVFAKVEYDDDLANVCMASKSSPKQMLSLLNSLIDDHEEWPAARRVMIRMYEVLLQNPRRSREFTSFLEQFWNRHNYSVPEDIGFIAGIDDEFSLAEQGVYGTVELAKESLLANLRKIKRNAEQ